MDLFAGHGFGFDDVPDVVVPGDLEDVLLDLVGAVGLKDLRSQGLGVLLERGGQEIYVRCGIGLAVGDILAQGLEVHAFVGLGAINLVGLREFTESTGEGRVVHRIFD